MTKTFIATVVIAVIGLILSKIAGFQGNKRQGDFEINVLGTNSACGNR
ncbi:hypothetical protein [Paenibacillus sp. FSL R5-0527]